MQHVEGVALMHGVAHATYIDGVAKSLNLDSGTLFMEEGLVDRRHSTTGVEADDRRWAITGHL